MKKVLLFLLIPFIFSFHLAEQTPVEVAESTLKISGMGEEVFYYGFSEGDQIIFDFEEVKGKELKEVEIIEMPSSSKFMDYKVNKIQNKTINVTKTGIYKFKFSNSAVSGRICKFKIQRIPASEETKNFNTNVYWKTIQDTTFTMVQEKYLVRKEYKTVTLVPTSEFFINSGSNATFNGGKSRISIPVSLPRNTKEWYYIFTASREKADVEKTKAAFNLSGELTNLIDQTGALNFGLDMLTKPPGGNVCDIYLLDYNNRGLFEAKAAYNYALTGTRQNIKSGIVKVIGGAGQTWYLGIKNPDDLYGIEVAIEVVAIILEEEWGVRDVQKFKVSTREEAYLKN